MKLKRSLLLAVGLALGLGAAHGRDDDAARVLAALAGDWVGRAETTPIGPRPYDIRLAPTGVGAVEGETDTGASVHHWRFFERDGTLHIRFLSTFGGNREPILLFLEGREGEMLLFRAIRPAFLSVGISLSAGRLQIDVFHHDEPHVGIRLRRRTDSP